MSVFVMVLAAGMAVGSGLEGVSAEVELPLDLHGEWEGLVMDAPNKVFGAALADGELGRGYPWGWEEVPYLTFTDEGAGRFRVRTRPGLVRLGLYRQEGEHLVFCLGPYDGQRPTSFAPIRYQQTLFMLHRVKPGK